VTGLRTGRPANNGSSLPAGSGSSGAIGGHRVGPIVGQICTQARGRISLISLRILLFARYKLMTQ
jgi:hypothetical protein